MRGLILALFMIVIPRLLSNSWRVAFLGTVLDSPRKESVLLRAAMEKSPSNQKQHLRKQNQMRKRRKKLMIFSLPPF